MMNNPERKHFLEIRDEDKLLETCIALKKIAKEYQEDFLRQSVRNREYYLGNQYLRAVGDRLEQRRRAPGQEWKPQTTRNVIGQTIDPVHAIIASASPAINIEACFPEEPVMFSPNMPSADMMTQEAYQEQQERYPTPFTGAETGEFFTEFLDRTWNSPYRKEHHARATSLLDAMITGTSFRGYSVREHPFRGMEVVVKNLQPHQVLLDPEGRDMVTFSDFRFIIIISELDVMTIQSKWKNVKESDFGNENEEMTYDTTTAGGFISRIFRRDSTTGSRSHPGQIHEEWTLRRYPVYMLYYAGWMPELMSTTPTDAQKKEKFPYPRGRIVTWINDRKIVEDKEVETWGFTFPLVSFQPNPIPHSGYGQSDVSKLIGPQDLINAFANILVSNAILNGNTQLMIETGAIDPRTFSVRPGAVMNFARDALRTGRVKQLFPGPIGQEVFQFMMNIEHFTKEELGDSSGIFRGESPGNIKSGIHMRTLQESAFTHKSFRIGLLDSSYEAGAFKEANLVQQFLPLSNPYYRGYMGIKEGMDLAMQNLIYKVEIESRKDLPFSSGGQFELFFSMLRSGDINHKEFFELTKFRISEDWQEKVDMAAEDAIPGLPPELRAQQELAMQQSANDIAAQAGVVEGGGAQPMGPEQAVGGGGQQGGQTPQSDQIPPIEAL